MKIYIGQHSATNDARSQWEARARLRIGGAAHDHAGIFRRNEDISAAYAEMYLRNPALYKWAGMAALTSASVGRGMYIMHYLRQSRLGGVVGLFNGEVAAIYETLGVGNWLVFADIYWQHLAYEQAGIAEIERIYRAGGLTPIVYEAWQQIDAGRRSGDQELIWEGNRGLLYYEQKVTLQPAVYDGREALWKALSGWIASPIPGHNETIEAFQPDANIAIFADRWRWISGSMLPAWQKLAARHPERVESRLHVRMIGGPPFLLPGMLIGRIGRQVYQAIGLGSRSGGWVPTMAINR